MPIMPLVNHNSSPVLKHLSPYINSGSTLTPSPPSHPSNAGQTTLNKRALILSSYLQMEDKSTTTTTTGIIAPTTPTAAKNGKTPPLDGKKNKKKRGAFTLFKAATLLIRRRPEGKLKPEVPSKVTWKKIVGSIRPFHLQAHSIAASPTIERRSDDVSTPLPPSPHAIINRSSGNSDDGMSQYGSTTNLQELDKGSESRCASAVNLPAVAKEGETDDNDDGISNNNVGDEMIDSKAEEFIAKFYQQMRVQHLEKVERYNKMMVARG